MFFLVRVFIFVSFLLASSFSYAGGLSILQGLTNETTTQISVIGPKTDQLHFSLYEPNGRLHKVSIVEHLDLGDPVNVAYKIKYEKLSLGNEYRFDVKTSKGKLIDSRFLKTLDTKKLEANIATVSCLNDFFMDAQKVMWDRLVKLKPDMILILGDSVYVDSYGGKKVVPTKASQIAKRYFETRNKLELYKIKHLIPTVAGWDDHDYGLNNGDRRFKLKSESLKIFNSFFAQDEVTGFLTRGPGNSSSFSAFGQNFVILDDRTFRTENRKGGKNETHFGKAQEEWLFSQLKEKTPNWLISGDQFYGGYHSFESFEGSHPKDFKRFIKRLSQSKFPTLFLGGDRHLSEIMRIEPSELGYETYEITSSGIHSTAYPGSLTKEPNKRMIVGRDGIQNFVMLKTKRGNNFLEVEAISYGYKIEKPLFSKKLIFKF